MRYKIKITILAIHKKEAFTQKEQDLASFAKAISHPARLAILNVLAQKDSCICGQIVEVLPLAQSTVSQHLKELKKAGLISGSIDGPRSCYCINWDSFGKFCDQFSDLFNKLTELRQDVYAGYLKDEKKIKEKKCC